MNYASDDQLTAVAQSCRDFEMGGPPIAKNSTSAEEISCEFCDHWDGARCVINVFDKVLTSLDQE